MNLKFFKIMIQIYLGGRGGGRAVSTGLRHCCTVWATVAMHPACIASSTLDYIPFNPGHQKPKGGPYDNLVIVHLLCFFVWEASVFYTNPMKFSTDSAPSPRRKMPLAFSFSFHCAQRDFIWKLCQDRKSHITQTNQEGGGTYDISTVTNSRAETDPDCHGDLTLTCYRDRYFKST